MRSLDVRARHAASNVAYVARRDAVILGDVGACARVGADRPDLIIRKPWPWKVAHGMAEPVNIGDVFFLATPPQVGGVDAPAVAAITMQREVVGRIGSLSAVQRKRDMASIEGAVADGERTIVSRLDDGAGPDPTPPMRRRFIDFSPVVGCVDGGWVHSFHGAIVPRNPTSPQGDYRA